MAAKGKIYPREGDRQTVYLKEVVSDPNIEVGEYTIYNDFAADPVGFERNNVLYHYPVNGDRLVIGKFCSLACGVRFLFNSANHALGSLSTYPFPIFWGEEWGIDKSEVALAWDNRGDRRLAGRRDARRASLRHRGRCPGPGDQIPVRPGDGGVPARNKMVGVARGKDSQGAAADSRRKGPGAGPICGK